MSLEDVYRQKSQQAQALREKVSRITVDLNESRAVLKTMRTLEATRKVFRLVGDVLTEHTVAQVLPSLEKHCVNLAETHEELSGHLERAFRDLNALRLRHEELRRVETGQGQGAPDDDSRKRGVLG